MVSANLGQLPYKRNINRTHDIRNNAQHNVIYPTDSDVSKCRKHTRDFLYKVSLQIWNLPFDKISLTPLIKHQRPKEFLINAENALNNADYKEAAGQSVAAITWTLNRVGTEIVGPTERRNSYGEFLLKESSLNSRTAGRTAFEALWKMQNTLLITTLGLNYADYIHYKEIRLIYLSVLSLLLEEIITKLTMVIV